uniref:unspecific monooxygenase n=1 Tax=Pectinophora gossypiella TaxID=13191 RepID=A0A1E1WPZ7_PECGO
MLFLLLLFLCSLLAIFILKNKNSDYWKKRNVAQVSGLLSKFYFGNVSLPEVYKKVYDDYPGEPYVGIFLGMRPALLIRDVENVQAVMAGEFQSFYKRGIMLNPQDVLADNVLFIDEFGRWKILRHKLSPIFTSSKLKNMFYILERCGRDFVERIKEDPKNVDNPFEALYSYTTASIAASVFGIDAQVKNTMDSPLLDMVKKAIAPTLKSNLIFAIANISPRLLQVFNLKSFGDYEEFFVGVVRNVIENRRNEKQKRHDFIDICLELQDQGMMKDFTTGYELEPSVEVLAAQAFFFFVAGADTSANTMHFTLLELSNNPNILKKVHNEIDELFDKCDEKLTYSDVYEKFPYLDKVVKEALRKFPPIGMIQRMCTKDTILPVGGVRVDKDCTIVLPVYAIHRDEKYYPNPDVFDPERFSPENEAEIPNYAYLPFGEGNRICLGMRLARLQVKVGLAWLLRRYTLVPQSVVPEHFEPSVFALRASKYRYDLVPRSTN